MRNSEKRDQHGSSITDVANFRGFSAMMRSFIARLAAKSRFGAANPEVQ